MASAFSLSSDPKTFLPLLPDADTAIVSFFWDGEDLEFRLIKRDELGQPALPGSLPIRIPRCKQEISNLLTRQDNVVREIRLAGIDHGDPAALRQLMNETKPKMIEIDQRLYERVQLERLLSLIEPDKERLGRVHLVLVPDQDMYRLSLHAAMSGTGTCLFEQVRSCRYALDLDALKLLKDIDSSRFPKERQERRPRICVFLNPALKIQEIKGTLAERDVLLRVVGAENVEIFGFEEYTNKLASRANFALAHNASSILWILAHGGPPENEYTAASDYSEVAEQFILLIDGELRESCILDLDNKYDFSPVRLVYIPCCFLPFLVSVGRSGEVEGFIPTLTKRGCRRVAGVMWPVSDSATAEFARFWAEEILENVFRPNSPSPHAFSLALSEAVRRFKADPRFDHPFYYAPYVLYGLG